MIVTSRHRASPRAGDSYVTTKDEENSALIYKKKKVIVSVTSTFIYIYDDWRA